MIEAPKSGPVAGRNFDFDALRERYYDVIGWDTETGKPSEKTMAELGIKEILEDLP